MDISKQRVLELRGKDYTMWEIADTIASETVSGYSDMDSTQKRRITDDLIYPDGGVYDICMASAMKYTKLDEEATMNLAASMIESACEDYGEAYTYILNHAAPRLSEKTAYEKYQKALIKEDHTTAKRMKHYLNWYAAKKVIDREENFFRSDICAFYLDMFSEDESVSDNKSAVLYRVTGEDVIKACQKQAKAGRWRK